MLERPEPIYLGKCERLRRSKNSFKGYDSSSMHRLFEAQSLCASGCDATPAEIQLRLSWAFAGPNQWIPLAIYPFARLARQ